MALSKEALFRKGGVNASLPSQVDIRQVAPPAVPWPFTSSAKKEDVATAFSQGEGFEVCETWDEEEASLWWYVPEVSSEHRRVLETPLEKTRGRWT